MKGWLVAGACTLAVAVGAAAAVGTGDQSTSDAPDTIVYHGRITTMDGRGSTVQALAIRAGEIVATGSDDDVRDLADGETQLIDLGGRRVLPGLIDGHLEGVRMGSSACFSRSPRFDALYKRSEALMDVADRAQRTPAGKWLFQTGGGWNVAQFDSPGMLTRAELDSIAPSHLVYLRGTGVAGGQLNSRRCASSGSPPVTPASCATRPAGRPGRSSARPMRAHAGRSAQSSQR